MMWKLCIEVDGIKAEKPGSPLILNLNCFEAEGMALRGVFYHLQLSPI